VTSNNRDGAQQIETIITLYLPNQLNPIMKEEVSELRERIISIDALRGLAMFNP
jgi:uncharacterized membrane protein